MNIEYSSSFIVGVAGFEPTTPCSQSRCANRTALHPDNIRLFTKAMQRYTFLLIHASISKTFFLFNNIQSLETFSQFFNCLIHLLFGMCCH